MPTIQSGGDRKPLTPQQKMGFFVAIGGGEASLCETYAVQDGDAFVSKHLLPADLIAAAHAGHVALVQECLASFEHTGQELLSALYEAITHVHEEVANELASQYLGKMGVCVTDAPFISQVMNCLFDQEIYAQTDGQYAETSFESVVLVNSRHLINAILKSNREDWLLGLLDHEHLSSAVGCLAAGKLDFTKNIHVELVMRLVAMIHENSAHKAAEMVVRHWAELKLSKANAELEDALGSWLLEYHDWSKETKVMLSWGEAVKVFLIGKACMSIVSSNRDQRCNHAKPPEVVGWMQMVDMAKSVNNNELRQNLVLRLRLETLDKFIDSYDSYQVLKATFKVPGFESITAEHVGFLAELANRQGEAAAIDVGILASMMCHGLTREIMPENFQTKYAAAIESAEEILSRRISPEASDEHVQRVSP